MRTKNPQQLNNARNVKNAQPQKSSNKNYKRVIVKLVRLLSARPSGVSLVAIGLSLPNPLQLSLSVAMPLPDK
jgi:hypothetical protein